MKEKIVETAADSRLNKTLALSVRASDDGEAMKGRILFVDDEAHVLEGLRLRLRHRRADWGMSFADSGQKALETLATLPAFDIIVTDMRMPGMDGAKLLGEVRDRYPSMARIMLTGHVDASSVTRAMAVVHHFVAKPCEAAVIETLIDRVLALQSRINDEAVKAAVGRAVGLPARPQIYHRLLTVMSDESACASDVATVVRQDEALCARLLHLANSAFFRPARPIVRIEDAVVFLGLNTVRHLALVAEIFRCAGTVPPPMAAVVEHLHRHAVTTSLIAADLMGDCHDKEEREGIFIAALLHDVGMLVMAMEFPDRVEQALAEAAASGCTLHAAEQKLFGLTHAEIGAHLLGLWHIPFSIVEAVADHHVPRRRKRAGFDLTAVVHVADALAKEFGPPFPGAAGKLAVDLDLELLEEMGIVGRLPGWRAMAAERAARPALL